MTRYDDDTPMTVTDHLIDDHATDHEINSVLRQMKERIDEMLKGSTGYACLFWSDRDHEDFVTLEHNRAALMTAWAELVADLGIL